MGGPTKAELVEAAVHWLEENPDAPIRERAAFGVFVACDGNRHAPITWYEISEAAGISVADAKQGLYSLREEYEMRR